MSEQFLIFRFNQLQPTYQSTQVPKFIPDQRSSPAQYSPNALNGGVQGLSAASPPPNGANLSELDTLLQDLSSARYGANLGKNSASIHHQSPPLAQNVLNDSIQRPSVDSLLDELSSAQNAGPIYAVPNG